MNVEIWSDVVCPWCYIGKKRFETALANLAGAAPADPGRAQQWGAASGWAGGGGRTRRQQGGERGGAWWEV